ncbi:MAG: ferredoxin family protein [Spirochaetales bacterium]|nr:ferredoxin family protein [Spirochaetales bacterium]
MGQVVIKKQLCKGCGYCVEACPRHLLEQSGEINSNGYEYPAYKGDGCTGCGFCFYACPELDAIEVYPDP